jgi:hypothetical protein
MSETSPVYFKFYSDKIPVLLNYFKATNPSIVYSFRVINRSGITVYVRPRADITYSGGTSAISSGSDTIIGLTLFPFKGLDGQNQTVNINIDVCRDNTCSSIIQTIDYPITILYRYLSSVNVLSRYTFDSGDLQGWNSTVGARVSTAYSITPDYSLDLYYNTPNGASVTAVLRAPQVTSMPVDDVYLVFLGHCRLSNFRKIHIYVDNELRNITVLDVRERWLYFGYYIGSINPSSIIEIKIDTYNAYAGGTTDVYIDDITFFTIP